MLKNFKKTTYKAFGLTISSDIFLRELPLISINENETDVVIEKSEDSTFLVELDLKDVYISEEDKVIFRVPEVGVFLIHDGKRIVFRKYEGADEDQIRLFLLGTCMGAILLQRKILPLHGSAIVIDGKAYAIVGESGAGKSTLASAFLQRGYQLLSDDVIPVTLDRANTPIVTPAYPQQKLWLESLQHFGMESSNFEPLFVRETKFAIPVESQFATEPLPLAGIFELVKGGFEEIAIHPIEKMERFFTLYSHTYRNFFMHGSGLMEWHFDMSSKMMNKLQFQRICRPITHFTANELVDLILTTLRAEENRDDQNTDRVKEFSI
ncbi:aldolase [Sporosarcina thermotolerans]|uniref:Aldolase n=1 Tax=Sporosarcina thermotolerans TaxID=633404 RepID=A0AAW9A542_9BACL|nr:aldolase [Sporosarcina thermotolerans]MDW0116267.1 aldolase [Sporosarcina thermotolerans]WHT49993.1 aldolase [Sporosarcina thermotolerans]